MSRHWELPAFALALGALVAAFFGESLFGGKVLSPADVLEASASFRPGQADYEPSNRLLMDPVLQFEPWLELNRAMLRRGRLPLWNPLAGCGAPHLANGQSAVFDPFHLIAYLGRLPEAHAWMAAARLWVAGIGMFLLAYAWGLGPWGRWFSGLTFPFCGFLVVWLLYPVTSAAVWMPWLLLATERLLNRPTPRSVAAVAVCAGLVLLGGHIQTSAHVLLAAGLYAASRVLFWFRKEPALGAALSLARQGLYSWAAATALGVALAAVVVVPLGCYLAHSPVWADREAVKAPFWRLARPRLLDAVCTALPYAFGSQRRGHPNLARALGVHNLNESAGGFAGLLTLVCLAPLALAGGNARPRVRFLASLGAVGALGAFRLPPVDNLLRALPVLGVTDNRRLTLWVAFALVLLGGIGLDQLAGFRQRKGWKRWVGVWLAAALALGAAAAAAGRAGPWLDARAREHYSRAAETTAGAEARLYEERARRQVHNALDFLPWYYATSAAELLALAGLAVLLRCGALDPRLARGGVLGLVLMDLFGFGLGLNPAISARDAEPRSPVIDYLRREVGASGRSLGVGAELPPNTLMRYGLADARNYDSVELARSLAFFAPLYEPGGGGKTSRREITWRGAVRARERLEAAGVQAIVGASPPPPGAFERVERVGPVWVARLNASTLARTLSGSRADLLRNDYGEIQIYVRTNSQDRIVVAQTFHPGWRAEVNGRVQAVKPHRGVFLAVDVGHGTHLVRLCYDPPEAPLALGISLAALGAILGLALTESIRSKNLVIGLDAPGRSRYNRWRDPHRTSRPVPHEG
jgi:hypothetical protein